MRLRIGLLTKENSFNKNYRSFMLSFIKHVLQKSNSDFFDELYSKSNPLLKDFTFSVFVPFEKDAFAASGKTANLAVNTLNITFSIIEYKTFIHFYNMFINYKGKEDTKLYPFLIQKIESIQDKPITKNSVLIKFLSPLVLRKHDRSTNKDSYIDCTQNDFLNCVNDNVNFMLAKLGLLNGDVKIELIPVQGKAKKTVVEFKNNKFSCSFGQFILQGESEVLNVLYKTGIGSRRSEGFGMFEVIQ